MTVDHGPADHEQEELWNVFGGLPRENENAGHSAQTASYDQETSRERPMPGMNEPTIMLGSTALGAGYDAAPAAKPFPELAAPMPQPERPEQKKLLGTPGRKLLAIGTAAVLSIGAVAGAVAAEKHGKRTVASAQATPSTPAVATTPPSPDTTEQSNLAKFAPNILDAQVDPQGNIVNSHFIPGLQGRSAPWADGTAYIPPLLKPNSFYGKGNNTQNTIDNTSQEFLTSLSYLWSVDPESKAFDTVLDDFTDEPTVKEAVLQQNRLLHERYGMDNQFILFDTGDDPASAAEGGYNAAQHPTIITAKTGTLYLRVLKKDCRVDYENNVCTDDPSKQLAIFSDATAFSTGDAAPIDISFAWDAEQEQDGLAHLTVKSYSTTIETGETNNNGFYKTWFPIDIDSARVIPMPTN